MDAWNKMQIHRLDRKLLPPSRRIFLNPRKLSYTRKIFRIIIAGSLSRRITIILVWSIDEPDTNKVGKIGIQQFIIYWWTNN